MPRKKTDDQQILSGLIAPGRPAPPAKQGVFATGIAGLDDFFVDTSGQPRGGFPRGTHWIFAGEPKIGKSLLRCHMMAAAQRQGLRVALVPSERDIKTTGVDGLTALGVDVDDPAKFFIIGDRTDGGTPFVAEDTLAAVAYAARNDLVDVVFIDSSDCLVPRSIATAIAAGDDTEDGKALLDQKQMAELSSVYGRWIPGVFGECSDHGVSLFIVAHHHERPGTPAFQDPRYIKGGTTLRHHATGVFWVQRVAKSKLRAAEQKVADDHWFFRLVLHQSRLSPKVGEEIRVALPLTTPLWESPLYQEGGEP